ncbi:phenylacetate--CoA ligase family protein [Heliophilum fasciatum]|uniref:Phenylacetate-CoA ligase n=1 Tax=Heliophilum fasciatum TaxID=35700 RepID=A0A4R2S0Y0_9FIRM|nr:AMP-binding protein [Heliophilum fasciatum]MCW2276752.1 phenylacetate-CoA ligase [Heliophilum fasciatum]TCP68867.1 phenylacetate-CoA ligase [Heliophilum fasciatum]
MNLPFSKRISQARTPAWLMHHLSGPDIDNMTPEALESYQKAALTEVIQQAYEHSPYYKQKFDEREVHPKDIQELADVAKLPFTTKSEMRTDPWLLLACDRQDIAIIHVSTGTTGGNPIYVMQTWRDYYLHDLAPGYATLVPVETGDRCLNALPYEMSSAGLAFHKTLMNSCEATVIPAGKGGAYSSPEKTVRLMKDLAPTVAVTSPSYAINLAETAAAASFDIRDLGLKQMWLTGEGCSSAFRQRVEQLWGTKANFYYGSLEGGVIGIECADHDGYHIAAGHSLVEIIDPGTGEVLAPGEIGEITVTCLLRYDTPLIRYRTEDLGYLDNTPCSCGVALPRLQLRGRKNDQIHIDGTDFSPFYLEEFLMRIAEIGNWYQFVTRQAQPDNLLIRTELASGVTPSDRLADKIASRMEYAAGLPCTIEFVSSMPRPGGKTVRVIHE